MYEEYSVSDPFPERLLDDYASRAKRLAPGSLSATALRTKSLSARILLARLATRGTLSLSELMDCARGATPLHGEADIDVPALAEMARVVALQGILPTDSADGVALFDLALRLSGPASLSPDQQSLHLNLALSLGRHERVNALSAI